MKYPGIKILLVLAITAVAFAGGAIIDYFNATPDGDNVKIEWKTEAETDINHFAIERKAPHQSYFEIATIQPKGSYSFYTYVDQSIYKTTDVIFVYRLKIVDNNQGVTYCSTESPVSPNISGVKRTWGSIKAMFR